MFDSKLYREACRELTAPEDKIEEIIAMTEKTNKKKIQPLRTALICAAAMAMMVVGGSAANPEAVQTIWGRVLDIVHVGQYRSEITMENGEQVTLLELPKAKVENREGRAILVVNGEDAADITDALDSEGRYVYKKTDEGACLVITVTGSIDDWKLTTSLDDPDTENPGLVGVVNSSDMEKERVDDVDANSFFITDGDLDDGEGNVTVDLYITSVEVPAQD